MEQADDDGPVVYVEGVCLRPDLRNLEITSKSVERMLEPLVIQVGLVIEISLTFH